MIDLQRAEINLGRMIIRTPIDGMIVMMSASADLILEQVQDTLLVPRSAVALEGDQSFVYVRSSTDERFAPRSVALGMISDHQVVVKGGLAEGDEIALIAAEVAN